MPHTTGDSCTDFVIRFTFDAKKAIACAYCRHEDILYWDLVPPLEEEAPSVY